MLKNLLFSSVVIAMGCWVGATLVFGALMFQSESMDAGGVLPALTIMPWMGVVGAAYVLPLCLGVAAITMPIALYVVRLGRLPRPVFDGIGGAFAGWFCTDIAKSWMKEIPGWQASYETDQFHAAVLGISLIVGFAVGVWRFKLLQPSPLKAGPIM
jgi:hypothetical protein